MAPAGLEGETKSVEVGGEISLFQERENNPRIMT